MPVVKLSQDFITHHLQCHASKSRIEWCDKDLPGLFIEVRASSQGQGTFYYRYKDIYGKTCTKKVGRSTEIDLAVARTKAKALRAEIALGANPRAEEMAEKSVLTFDNFFYQHYLPYVKPRKRSWDRDEELYRLRIKAAFGSKLYINVDDDLSGVIQKNSYAEEYGFNMLAEGHRNFTASSFLELMADMTANNQANGVIIVLDTLKKFANLMDKVNSSKLTKVIRGFIMKGGSVIALAHANKRPDVDGKPIFTGTTDILDDFDCAYRMYPIDGEPDLKTIEFENIKRRGDVPSVVAYSYSDESGISYTERFLTVQQVDDAQLNAFKLTAELKSDTEIINVVTTCITEGINTKTKLAFAVSERAGIGQGKAIKFIDKYTGEDTAIHKWAYSVGQKGAKSFTVLATPASYSETPIAT